MKGKPATEYCKQTFCLNKPQSDMVLTTDGEKVQTRNNLPGKKKKSSAEKCIHLLSFICPSHLKPLLRWCNSKQGIKTHLWLLLFLEICEAWFYQLILGYFGSAVWSGVKLTLADIRGDNITQWGHKSIQYVMKTIHQLLINCLKGLITHW